MKIAGARRTKDELKQLIENRVNQNIKTNGRDHRNILDESLLSPANVISVFESNLSRIIQAKADEFTDDLITIQIYYYQLFKDLVYFGFWFKGEHYVYFSSSAGQIRRKKGVFIKESTWLKHQQSIMCGLTIERINQRGGCNINKLLAYLALQNSATDVWSEFNIDKSIVIDDFESEVSGIFDSISDITFEIERVSGKVIITHTDGAGMMLPRMGPNRMIRLPFVKGLLGVFDYRRFIEEHGASPVLKDIYGVEHNLIEEDIEVIFTKSQFKMYKYYDSWDEYKKLYHEFGCMAGYCNIERERIPNNRITYQMLQSLTDFTDDEFDILISASNRRLETLSSSPEDMLRAFGATLYNVNPTPFQQALRLYPNLLNDTYLKETLRNIKESMIKEYRSGKLEVRGKYQFVLPDFYAACQHWFLGEDNPEGLLRDGEVYSRLFPNDERLDCLRSPHLYQEHGIRYNLGYRGCGSRMELAKTWFNTNAVYTSCHDLISRILQFDCDGDMLLVIGDENTIRIATRNMRGIVPLYYEMKKAAATEVNKASIYDGLISAFKHSNIGIYSNSISKIKNSPEFLSDGPAHEEALKAIKLLTMQNNYCIDAAKTLYMPEPPEEERAMLARYTSVKLPSFFKYAKDKRDNQVLPENSSIVNRLRPSIINPKINTRHAGLGKIDYTLLMENPDIEVDEHLMERYLEFSNAYHLKMNPTTYNGAYLASLIVNDLEQFGYDRHQIADILVKGLYRKPRTRKEVLWRAFGDIILEHMRKNIPETKTRIVQCVDCGDYFEVGDKARNVKPCHECQHAYKNFQIQVAKKNAVVGKLIKGLVIPPDALAQLNSCGDDYSSMPVVTLKAPK